MSESLCESLVDEGKAIGVQGIRGGIPVCTEFDPFSVLACVDSLDSLTKLQYSMLVLEYELKQRMMTVFEIAMLSLDDMVNQSVKKSSASTWSTTVDATEGTACRRSCS